MPLRASLTNFLFGLGVTNIILMKDDDEKYNEASWMAMP